MICIITPQVSQQRKRSFELALFCHLTEIHGFLFRILGDAKCSQVAREASCLGLAVCRSLSIMHSGNQLDLWEPLNRQLTVVTAMDQSNRIEDRNDAVNHTGIRADDSEFLVIMRVFMNIAIDINYPQVFYILAISSVHVSNQFWSMPWCRERYTGFNLMGDEWLETPALRLVLSAHVDKLLPTLLIARYNPDKNTSAIMNKVWSSLESDKDDFFSISAHLIFLIDRLIEKTTSKMWKVRVGACKALSDVIVGRNWLDFGGGGHIADEDDIMFEQQNMPCESASTRIARLIRVTLRSLDDIRLAVREAGESLSTSVKSLVISLCDSSSSHSASSENSPDVLAAATCLPYLIKVGLNQSCVEAANFATSCLIGIVDVCQPKLMQPFIPSLLASLLTALSEVEPALLNHLQARASGDTPETEREVEQLRLRLADRSSLASAITKVLNMVPHLDLESQRLAVFHLEKCLRTAHGLTTRSAVTDAVNALATLCPDAFIMNASTSRLLHGLYLAMDQEKKDTLMRGKFAYTLGHVANLAPPKAVRAIALKACDSYLGNSDSKYLPVYCFKL